MSDDNSTTPLSAENLGRMGSKLPPITRDTSAATTQETQSSRGISRGYSRSDSMGYNGKEDFSFDDDFQSKPKVEAGLEAQGLEAQGFSTSASAGPDINTDDVCSVQVDQLGVETIPIFVAEMQKILDRQASENKANNPSGAIENTFIDQVKIDRLPKPIEI